MPPVKGKSKSSNRPKGRATGRGRRKPASLTEKLRSGMAQLGAGLLSFMAVGLAALAMIVVLMLMAGGYFSNFGDRVDDMTSKIVRAAGFSVKRVTVRGGESLGNHEIMSALNTERHGSVLGRSLWHVDMDDARKQIEALGWTRSAAVQRLWPDTIHISLVERRPAALWLDASGEYHLIDAGGYVISTVEPVAHTDMPVLAGTTNTSIASPLLNALETKPELKSRIAVIRSVGERRFDLRFRNDFTARLPEGPPEKALERLEGLGAGTGKLAETLDYIDLRDPQWAYLKPKSE